METEIYLQIFQHILNEFDKATGSGKSIMTLLLKINTQSSLNMRELTPIICISDLMQL